MKEVYTYVWCYAGGDLALPIYIVCSRLTFLRAKIRNFSEEWRMKSEEFYGICWKTQIQVQITIYKVQFIGWFVRRWGEYSLIRWVQGRRSKPSAIAISHRYQLSPLAIANSCICCFLLHPLVIIPTLFISYIFHQRKRLHNEYFCMNMHKRRRTGWFDNAVANRHFHRTTPKHLWKCRNDSDRVQLRTNGNSGKLQRMFRSGSADV